jgi:hypothetical protein
MARKKRPPHPALAVYEAEEREAYEQALALIRRLRASGVLKRV